MEKPEHQIPLSDGLSILSLHPADDSRVFEREAIALARVFQPLRLITIWGESGTRRGVEVIVVSNPKNRFERLLIAPILLLKEFLRRPTRFVFLQDGPLLPLAPLLDALGFDVVYDVHEDYPNMLRHRPWLPAPLRPLLSSATRLAEGLLATRCKAIVAATAPLLEGFNHAHRLAVYNLLTEDFVARATQERTPLSMRPYHFVHLGALSPQRCAFLISIVDALLERDGTIKGMVIGAPPSLAAQLRSRYPERTLLVHERVPHAHVPGLLGQCRIGLDLHPVLLPHLRLAVPVKVFEYAACGLAVVSSSLPELEALLHPQDRNLMRLINSQDPSAYAQAVLDLLSDQSLLETIGEALRESATKRYVFTRHEGELRSLFLKLAAQPPRGIPKVLRHLSIKAAKNA